MRAHPELGAIGVAADALGRIVVRTELGCAGASISDALIIRTWLDVNAENSDDVFAGVSEQVDEDGITPLTDADVSL